MAIESSFDLLNDLIADVDDYLLDVLYETIIESLALSGKVYYDEAKHYLNDEGIKLLELKKNDPPLGFKPVDY